MENLIGRIREIDEFKRHAIKLYVEYSVIWQHER